jgi:Cft2 family RNA processing exonuclease
MESTYGDRVHGDRKFRIERLGAVLSQALADGGKVYIPAFSLGRSQELLYEMDRLFSDSELRAKFPELGREKVPVFLDSPLGLKITEIYSQLVCLGFSFLPLTHTDVHRQRRSENRGSEQISFNANFGKIRDKWFVAKALPER